MSFLSSNFWSHLPVFVHKLITATLINGYCYHSVEYVALKAKKNYIKRILLTEALMLKDDDVSIEVRSTGIDISNRKMIH